MKILKKIFIGIGFIIALLFIIAIFVPKEKYYGAQILINKPTQEVYDYVKFLKNQEKFSYFFLEDPNITSTYQGTDGEVGASCSWKSQKMGDGTQTISKLTPPSKVETTLDFGMGEPAHSAFILSETNNNQTQVEYGVKMTSPYPMNIMFLFFGMDKAFEESLSNLKKQLEP